ncbi:15252_t:CDS:1, partial [Entrophospora sp. SA101]
EDNQCWTSSNTSHGRIEQHPMLYSIDNCWTLKNVHHAQWQPWINVT